MNMYKKLIFGLGFIVALPFQCRAMVGEKGVSVVVQPTDQMNAECVAFIQTVDDVVREMKAIQNIAQGIIEVFEGDNSRGWVELGNFDDYTFPRLLKLFNEELRTTWNVLSSQDKNEQQVIDAADLLSKTWVDLLREPVISFESWIAPDQNSYKKLLDVGKIFVVPAVMDNIRKVNDLGLDFQAMKDHLVGVKRQLEDASDFTCADRVIATNFVDYCIEKVEVLGQEYSCQLSKKGITIKRMVQLGLFGLIV